MGMKKLTAKQIRERRRKSRMYGLKKIRVGEKVCWLSAENKNGWSLGFAWGKKTLWLRNLRLANRKEVERAMKSAVVYIHLKNSKEKTK